MNSFIDPYKTKLDKEMNQVIATVDEDLVISKPNNLLGNFLCDLSLDIVKKNGFDADLVVMNNGGLRAPIYKGDITNRSAFKLMPFDNMLVIVTMKGEAMTEMFEYLAKFQEPTNGLTLGIKNKKPIHPMINGKKFDPNKEYKVVTSDYLYTGGDQMFFFQKGSKMVKTDLLIRDSIIDYCKAKKVIKVEHNKRLYYVK
ncbi:bifunctional NAD pyrophosphatase/5'-nucleotidase [Flammeovirga sp. MY04]|nr:5'-nucleotidase C-terminal domain-containing protein [Flammeovirga sp. MY04]ANQ48006.2 bifunctional NAD pyrophosphatase/5'-nucleotidase [Flammeovirga sp. MY04]